MVVNVYVCDLNLLAKQTAENTAAFKDVELNCICEWLEYHPDEKLMIGTPSCKYGGKKLFVL